MSAHDFTDIAQVTEHESARDVNTFLEAGWKLLNIYNRAYGDGGAQQVVYVLGWPRSAGAVVDPIEEQQKRLLEQFQ